MGLSLNPLDAVSSLIGKVADVYNKRQQAKTDLALAQSKIQQATLEQNAQVELTSAQWEAIAIAQTEHSWKDEYVTIVVTLPFLLLFIGGLCSAVFGNTSILEGAVAGINAIQATGVDVGDMMQVVVYAAVGVKFVKRLL